MMYVTYPDLIEFSSFLVALITLIYLISQKKK